MENGYIVINGKKYPMDTSFFEIDKETKMKPVLEAISKRNQIHKDLKKRSDELHAQSDRIRHKDPIKARILEHRAIVLADEVYRIEKENKGAMSIKQIRRSMAIARLALVKDGITCEDKTR